MSMNSPVSRPDRATFGYAVSDIARLLRRVFDRRAQHLGLTRAQWRALHRIERAPGLSQNALAEDLDLEPIAIGRVVDRLERSGFVERRADLVDRRRWNLHPSPKGDEVMAEMRGVADLLHADILAGVHPDELQRTLDVLKRIKSTLVGLDQACREPARPKQPKRRKKADR